MLSYGPGIAIKGLSSYEQPAGQILFRYLFDDAEKQIDNGKLTMSIETMEYLVPRIFYNKNFIENLFYRTPNVEGEITGTGKRSVHDRKYICKIIRDNILNSPSISITGTVNKYFEMFNRYENMKKKRINAGANPVFIAFLEEIFNDEFFDDKVAKKAKMASRLKK
jgi:hypothetical protein